MKLLPAFGPFFAVIKRMLPLPHFGQVAMAAPVDAADEPPDDFPLLECAFAPAAFGFKEMEIGVPRIFLVRSVIHFS